MKEAMEGYRVRVFTQGESGADGTDAVGNPLRRGIPREEVLRMISKQGRIGMDEYLRCRVRYFTDGVAVGSKEYVEGVFRRFRGYFSKGRQSGARRMRGLEPELFSARSLRVDVFG